MFLCQKEQTSSWGSSVAFRDRSVYLYVCGPGFVIFLIFFSTASNWSVAINVRLFHVRVSRSVSLHLLLLLVWIFFVSLNLIFFFLSGSSNSLSCDWVFCDVCWLWYLLSSMQEILDRYSKCPDGAQTGTSNNNSSDVSTTFRVPQACKILGSSIWLQIFLPCIITFVATELSTFNFLTLLLFSFLVKFLWIPEDFFGCMHNFLLIIIIITPRRSSEKEEIIQALFSFLFVLFLHLLLQLMGHEVLKLRQQLERLQTTQRWVSSLCSCVSLFLCLHCWDFVCWW